MAGKGRPPRPLEVLRMEGSHHASERHGEVAIIPGEPQKPSGMRAAASAMWDRMVERMHNQGILSEMWREPLIALCQQWDRYETLTAECLLREIDDPLWEKRDKAYDAYVKLARDFGQTPSSKTGIRTEPGLPKNRKGYIKRA